MTRSICLFTGQWADLPLESLLPKVKAMGFDGVELACWGDHFEVGRALREDDYCAKLWSLLDAHGIEIAGGLGPLRGKIWRIGLMGTGSTPENVELVLGALGEALTAQGFSGGNAP